ncbi:Hpt domain-containing protein [Beijerinckia sp. L45]|uniref:Hpt domain-containing protein n=1 Tax=Beijerinckia sp. L45 TaxID=1641855 RepID=UPI00131E42C2|nr:Hpt domain-containing protein [Beijerinckia sp. L45]
METRMPRGSLNVVNAARVPPARGQSTEEHDLEKDRPALTPHRNETDTAVHALDSAYLTSQTFGDIELEIELLELFVVQARRLVPKLPTDDVRERADTAHLLKGSARAIGAPLLATAVEIYEQATETQQAADQPAYRAVATALEQTEAAIAARLSELQA